MDHGRDPCLWVILNDLGGAFCMGAIGGNFGVWGLFRSIRADVRAQSHAVGLTPEP